jgi:hypothetical protein
MKTLTRDVLLLGSAATLFLLLAFVEPVGAADQAVSAPVAAPPVAIQATAISASLSPVPAQVATAEEPRRDIRREKRCDRVGRIGKFAITRCD